MKRVEVANSQAERLQSQNSTMSFGWFTRTSKRTQAGAKTWAAGEREIRLSTAERDSDRVNKLARPHVLRQEGGWREIRVISHPSWSQVLAYGEKSPCPARQRKCLSSSHIFVYPPSFGKSCPTAWYQSRFRKRAPAELILQSQGAYLLPSLRLSSLPLSWGHQQGFVTPTNLTGTPTQAPSARTPRPWWSCSLGLPDPRSISWLMDWTSLEECCSFSAVFTSSVAAPHLSATNTVIYAMCHTSSWFPTSFFSLSWGNQQPRWGAPLPPGSYLCQDRLDSSSKRPKYTTASPPRISSGSVWLSALQEPENDVLLCRISNKSLASKRLMAGHCYSGWVRKKRVLSLDLGKNEELGHSCTSTAEPCAPPAADDFS